MKNTNERHRTSAKIIQLFTQLTASTTWQCIDEITLAFRTHHPQGLVKIHDSFYVSSVEMITPPEKLAIPQDGYDRTAGDGIGHLFHFDITGRLISDITVKEGTIYHPGGIDDDGDYIWMPVAEYRPDSQSIIYRIHAETLHVDKVFRFHDHIGALAYNRLQDSLHGASWGSRKFYTWHPAEHHIWGDSHKEPTSQMSVNGSHYIDYQDGQFLEEKYMLCGGLKAYDIPNIGPIALGGLELIDLDLQRAIHQIPIVLYSPTMRPMTQNPFYVELYQDRLRFYFIPDDEESTLYIYEALT